MTLWERYLNATFEATSIRWKIFDRETRRKLCDDYGQLRFDELDDKQIFDITVREDKKGKFFRVTVY